MRIGLVRTASSPCRCAEAAIKGLEALGHEYVLADSETIELQAPSLAADCDLIIDHTDTYRGSGLFRAMVRVLLEDAGARVVGSDARACFLADNKVAAKARMANAGIPVPPGIVMQSAAWEMPAWLRPPLVLKPAYEHMSRGMRVVHSVADIRSTAVMLLESLRQPILLESFIRGRELAVSLIEGPEGLQVLPVLEWGLGRGSADVLTEEFKLLDSADERHRILKANLPEEQNQELEMLARSAFRALGLRHYARFDVRMSSGGCFYFLEANTTPSLERGEALAASAQWAGLDYPALLDRLLRAAQMRSDRECQSGSGFVAIALPGGPVEMEPAEGVSRFSDSSIELAGLLDARSGETVLDIGCGSGLLSIAAAKLGAARVVAADLDSAALQAVARNARRNQVEDRIEIRSGSWYEALGTECEGSGSSELYDIIIATPPQTPGPRPFGPKYGGRDGTLYLLKVLDGAPALLKPESGRLWMMAISLANPRRLWRRLQELFAEVVLVHQSERLFNASEYEMIEQGLFNYLESLRSSGISEFSEVGKGRYAFRNLFIRASRPRKF